MEIPDYPGYETMTPVRELLKIKKNLCNHLLKSL